VVLAFAGCQRAEPPAQPVALAAGTTIEVGLDRGLSTERNRAGDEFTATLGVAVNGLPAGSRVHGHITASHPSGPQGRAAMGITLDSVEYRGKTVPVSTELIGGGAGLAAVLNGQGGKESGSREIEIPADTMFLFRLKQPVSFAP
jgi:hypothetical protein